uniref:Uncharacterized protein LOC104266343 n=1 Tax=Phallusia mammillata TaxID=59560 RepID=A0A6F9DJT7_9ASCI|nr:uncharacterized protein LOC104266343 [Phallusia mammillata]
MSSRLLLEDVVRSCHYLEYDKATDRKKNADKLNNLIQNPQVVLVLDEKSKTGKTKDGTYTAVFKAVQGYLFKESEATRSKWDTLTDSVQSTRTVKLNQICTLLRLVSKTAVKNGPKLKCSEIVESILIILKRNFQSKLFGKTYLDILTQDILVHRKYVNQISLDQYKEFIAYCTKCFVDQPPHLGSVQVASVMKSLIDSVVMQFDPTKFHDLIDFFSKLVQIVRKSVQPTFIDHSLATLNKFIRWQAQASKARVVLLGQEILQTLVALISSKKVGKTGFHLAVDICLFLVCMMFGREH